MHKVGVGKSEQTQCIEETLNHRSAMYMYLSNVQRTSVNKCMYMSVYVCTMIVYMSHRTSMHE